MRNTTQPLYIIIENPVIEEVTSKNEASCNIASSNQTGCTIQTKTFSIENMETIEESSNDEKSVS